MGESGTELSLANLYRGSLAALVLFFEVVGLMADWSFQEWPLGVLQGVNRVNLGWMEEVGYRKRGMDTKLDEFRSEVERSP
jgi:hypothetical protein